MLETDRYRRVAGTTLGGLLGLLYGLVSQLINPILIPGVPLYQPPFGTVGNIFLWLLIGAILGLVSSWAVSSPTGIILGSAIGAVLILAATFASGKVNMDLAVGNVVLAFIIFLPIAGALVPVLAVLRWVIDQLERTQDIPLYRFERLWRVLVLVVIMVGLGFTSMVPAQGRWALNSMHAMLQQGLPAASQSALPEPLQVSGVGGFVDKHGSTYRMEWTRRDLTRFGIGYPASAASKLSVGIAHFDNGWKLACMYIDPSFPPRCREFIPVATAQN